MVVDSDRLVRRIQRQLTAVGPVATTTRLTGRDAAELRNRIRQLRSLSDGSTNVKLSQYVEPCGSTSVFHRVGGERVATEV